jgi:phage virion morphogenesis protein
MSTAPIVSIEYEGEAVRQMLNELTGRIGNLYSPMANIGEYLLMATDDRFEQEVDPDGVPWQPNSPSILAFKRENKRILKILQSTGRLRGSITYLADETSVAVGTNIGYAPDHQLGLNGMAQRSFLGISAGDEAVILEILEDHLLSVT